MGNDARLQAALELGGSDECPQFIVGGVLSSVVCLAQIGLASDNIAMLHPVIRDDHTDRYDGARNAAGLAAALHRPLQAVNHPCCKALTTLSKGLSISVLPLNPVSTFGRQTGSKVSPDTFRWSHWQDHYASNTTNARVLQHWSQQSGPCDPLQPKSLVFTRGLSFTARCRKVCSNFTASASAQEPPSAAFQQPRAG